MSHSKRNTSLAFFTSHERSLLKSTWGSQATRLSRDSFLPFASCKLCLLPARDPVACNSTEKADIFCRECALNDLMSQRKEIKRLEREVEVEKGEVEDEEVRRRDEVAKRDLEEFERVSMGLEAKVGGGLKRKAEEMHGKGEARRKVGEGDGEKTETSFWVPGVDVSASNGHKDVAKPLKLKPLCPASTPATKHDFSMKGLTAINFTEQEGKKGDEKVRLCPSCKKNLGNSSKAMLAKPCGHVICGTCYDTFVKPDSKRQASEGKEEAPNSSLICYVCEADLTDTKSKTEGKKDKDRIKPGIVLISCEGTGFAGSGANVAKREGTAFTI
jgi:nitric oxide synthase-interacting protein